MILNYLMMTDRYLLYVVIRVTEWYKHDLQVFSGTIPSEKPATNRIDPNWSRFSRFQFFLIFLFLVFYKMPFLLCKYAVTIKKCFCDLLNQFGDQLMRDLNNQSGLFILLFFQLLHFTISYFVKSSILINFLKMSWILIILRVSANIFEIFIFSTFHAVTDRIDQSSEFFWFFWKSRVFSIFFQLFSIFSNYFSITFSIYFFNYFQFFLNFFNFFDFFYNISIFLVNHGRIAYFTKLMKIVIKVVKMAGNSRKWWKKWYKLINRVKNGRNCHLKWKMVEITLEAVENGSELTNKVKNDRNYTWNSEIMNKSSKNGRNCTW
jgi:hypothetical protein